MSLDTISLELKFLILEYLAPPPPPSIFNPKHEVVRGFPILEYKEFDNHPFFSLFTVSHTLQDRCRQ